MTATTSSQAKSRGALIIGLLLTLVPIAGQFAADRAIGWMGIDFGGYYCGALVQREGGNPYFAQALHACERAAPKPFYRPPANVTVPAPYPPYALALFYPFTLLPFVPASILWWLLLVAALWFSARALARIAQQPWSIAWAALALSAGLTAFSAGNLMPVALAALLAAALALTRNRPIEAAVAVAIGMIEPHVALPAAIALAFGYRAIRLPLGVAALLLAALSVLAGGVGQTLAYFASVLPAHALAEVSRDNQYSLSSVMAALGVPDTSAALYGSLSYAIMTGLGTLAALRLARRLNEPALIVLVPPAISLLGGSFVHTVEIAAAVPAALLLYLRAPVYRTWIFAALILLAVPWMMATSLTLTLASAFPVAYLTYVLWRHDRTTAVAAAVGAFALILGLFTLAAQPVHHAAIAHAYPPIDPRLAEASWRALVLGNTTNRPVMWLLRLPTWIGLLALAIPALMLARRKAIALAPQVSS